MTKNQLTSKSVSASNHRKLSWHIIVLSSVTFEAVSKHKLDLYSGETRLGSFMFKK